MIDKNSFDGSLMTKGAFFKKAKMNLAKEEIQESVKKYIDLSKNEVKVDLARYRNCSVCGSTKNEQIFKKNAFSHVKCSECSFVFVNPILNTETLNNHYRDRQNNWAQVSASEQFKEFSLKYHQFHIEHINRINKSGSNTLLDVGCNAGEFLLSARNSKFEVYGHELNQSAVKIARERGLKIYDQNFSSDIFQNPNKFGIVTLFGVLEHLPDPQAALNEISKIILPNGVLVLLVPNIDSIATKILQEKCNTFDGIEHLNFWNEKTLRRLLNNHGFELIHAETTISEIFSINNYLNYENPYYCDKEYDLLLDVLTPEWIHSKKMGHHLCAYAVPKRNEK